MTEEEFYTEQDEVLKQLEYRREHFDEIAKKIDAFILEKYGITEFVKTFYRFLGEEENYRKPDFKSGIFLARAIPSFTLEDMYVDCFASIHNLHSQPLGLSCDSLSGSSEDKMSRVLLTEVDTNISKKIASLEKVSSSLPIFSLRTDDNESLFDWHVSKRHTFLSDSSVKDFSLFLKDLFLASELKPEYIHLFDQVSGKMKKVTEFDSGIDDSSYFRPCVSWWYPIFLSIFSLDNVLYDDYSKQLNSSDNLFSALVVDSYREVQSYTGLKPLILPEKFTDKVSFSYISESLNNPNNFKKQYVKFVDFLKKQEIFDEQIFFTLTKEHFTF